MNATRLLLSKCKYGGYRSNVKSIFNPIMRRSDRNGSVSLIQRRSVCSDPTSTNTNVNDTRMNIIGITREELARDFERFGLEKYRADQVQLWLYNKGATEFDQMINLPKDLRKKLNEKYIISTGEVVKDTLSNDGTRKWLINFGGQEVETVFIPESTRGTLCVSSQVGCSMSCTFCHTGTQPLVRNLKAGEIIGQLMTAKRALFDFPTAQDKVVSNIVFMGQGEPFYNYRNVSSAIRVMTDPNCFSMSKRRLTVSTSGIVPNIMKLGEDFHGINLAISLHAVRDDLRSEIVPANKQWPIAGMISYNQQ
jgi:23S rRNA (adenine2503-C2)-methyltransferase